MIYLIGGPPKCGKTTLAKKLSKELNVPWVSSDTLQVVVRRYASQYLAKKQFDKLFPHTLVKGKDNDETYRNNTPKAITRYYIQQARATYDAVDAFCSSEIIDGNDYVLEGYHITPELVERLIKKYGKQNFRSVFLLKKNVDEFLRNLKKSTTPNDWILAKTNNKETFVKIAEMISQYSEYFETEAKKFQLTVMIMDGNFKKQLTKASSKLQGHF